MASRLRKVKLDEVSLVDHPANASARVMLTKRKAPPIAKLGVRFLLGFPASGGSKVQSVLFAKEWTPKQAETWLAGQGFTSTSSVTKSGAALVYEQMPVEAFTRCRVVTPGASTVAAMAAVSKQLNAEDSWNVVQSLVGNALRDHLKVDSKDADAGLATGPWIRDFFNDYVVYDRQGQTYRIPYSIREEESGDNVVTFDGPPEIVDLCYLTEAELAAHGIAETAPANNDIQKLSMRMTTFNRKLDSFVKTK
jgi:hypothetical protein